MGVSFQQAAQPHILSAKPSLMPLWLMHLGNLGLISVAVIDSPVIPLPLPGSTGLLMLWHAAHGGGSWLLVPCAVTGSLPGGYSRLRQLIYRRRVQGAAHQYRHRLSWSLMEKLRWRRSRRRAHCQRSASTHGQHPLSCRCHRPACRSSGRWDRRQHRPPQSPAPTEGVD